MFFILFNQLNFEGRNSTDITSTSPISNKEIEKKERQAIQAIKKQIKNQLDLVFKTYIDNKKESEKISPEKYDYHYYLEALDRLQKTTPTTAEEKDLIYIAYYIETHLNTLVKIAPLYFNQNVRKIQNIIDLELLVTPKQKVKENYKYTSAIKNLSETFYKSTPVQEINQIIGKDNKETNTEKNLNKLGLPVLNLQIDKKLMNILLKN